MANQEHLKILKKGFKVWNQWREDNPDVTIDFSGADFFEGKLFEANLMSVNLSRATLFNADLSHANLHNANLHNANLRGANLIHTDLSSANLRNTNLSHANLSGADLRDADIRLADLRLANLSNANLSGSNLRLANLGVTDLRHTIFTSADITGANLYATAREYWKIKGIKCDYIYFNYDSEGEKERTPKDRDFRPGEFEELYKWRPLNDFERLIERSIEFPPEYKQAGVSILNYFAEILRKKYPESEATVQIKQNGLKVIMTIDPLEGDRQTFEEELNRFGLVATGKITPEEYAGNNPLLLIELKSELRSAYNKIELQKELIHYQERELKKSDIQIERFFNILEKGITPDITVSPTIIVSPTIKGDESSIKARDITDSKLAAGNDNKIIEAKGNGE